VENQGHEVIAQPQAIGSPADEDWALIAAVLEKDRKATAEFVDRYAADLYRYVRARLAPHAQLGDKRLQCTVNGGLRFRNCPEEGI
jgi:hypothetical protein